MVSPSRVTLMNTRLPQPILLATVAKQDMVGLVLLNLLMPHRVLVVVPHSGVSQILSAELLLGLDRLNSMVLTPEVMTLPRRLAQALRCKVDVQHLLSTVSQANKEDSLHRLSPRVSKLLVAILNTAVGLAAIRALTKILDMAAMVLIPDSALTVAMVAAEVGMVAMALAIRLLRLPEECHSIISLLCSISGVESSLPRKRESWRNAGARQRKSVSVNQVYLRIAGRRGFLDFSFLYRLVLVHNTHQKSSGLKVETGTGVLVWSRVDKAKKMSSSVCQSLQSKWSKKWSSQ